MCAGKVDARPAPRDGCENAPIGDLLDKRLAFVTGKGGVGKTTVAYALGAAAAAAGRRTIVCEIAAQHRGPAIFGRRPAAGETRLAKGLWTISVDPDTAVREYLQVQLPVRAMGNLLHRSRLFNYLVAATPGLREMVTMGKVWELAQDRRRDPGAKRTYDTVIVDAPATGHGIAFLQTPGNFRELARVGPIARQAGLIEQTICDHDHTGVAIVALGEEMAVNESIELEAALREPAEGAGFAVDRVFFNALYPQRFSAAEVERIAAARQGAEGPAEPPLRAAAEEAARARSQRAQLERLRAATGTPLTELPFVFAERIGAAEIGDLAEAIA
jgi:anion-transporting  ArsA/GET3 family ATPase